MWSVSNSLKLLRQGALGLTFVLTLSPVAQGGPQNPPSDPNIRLRQSSLEVMGLLTPGDSCCFSPLGLWRNFALAELAARGDAQVDFQRVSALTSEELKALVAVDPLSTFGHWRSAWFVPTTPPVGANPTLYSLPKLDGTIERLPFQQPSMAARAINQWGRAPGLVSPAQLQQSQSVLVSDVKISTAPSPPFDPGRTNLGRFHALSGDRMVSMMRGPLTVRLPLDWASLDTRQEPLTVDIPLSAHKRLTIVLPPTGRSLESFEASLNESRLSGFLESLQPCEVQLLLPRLYQSDRRNLTAAVSQLGLVRPFSGTDFGGLRSDSGSPVAWRLATIVQQVQVQLQERPDQDQKSSNTKPAGKSDLSKNDALKKTQSVGLAHRRRPSGFPLTGHSASVKVLKPVQPLPERAGRPLLRIDRPFLYLLRDEQTARIYVMGRYLGGR